MTWTIIDGEPVLFEETFFPGTHNTTVTLGKPKERWRLITFCLNDSKIESSSCRCATTSTEKQQKNKEFCMSNSVSVAAAYARRFPERHWSFLGPGTEESWYATHTYKPDGLWDTSAELTMVNLRKSGHPLIRGTSALSRGSLKSKGCGKTSIHYSGDPATAELSFRINFPSISSVSPEQYRIGVKNTLSRCQILSSSSTGKLVAEVNDESESKVEPSVVSILPNSLVINVPVLGNLVRQHKETFENFPEDIRVSKACDDAGFVRVVSRGQYFVTIHDIELAGFGCAGSCGENTSRRGDERSKPKGWIRGNTKNAPVLEVKVTNFLERYGE